MNMNNSPQCFKVCKYNIPRNKWDLTPQWEQPESSKMSSLMIATHITPTYRGMGPPPKTRNNFSLTPNFSEPSKENLRISKKEKEANSRKATS